MTIHPKMPAIIAYGTAHPADSEKFLVLGSIVNVNGGIFSDCVTAIPCLTWCILQF